MPTRRKSRQLDRAAALGFRRTLHLVDVENLCGTGGLTPTQVRDARALVMVDGQSSATDHWVVGASSSDGAVTLAAWCDARRVAQHGEDGADKALLTVLDEDAATRYARVVVYSGDGIFADPLARIAAAGVDTTVVARP
jgi:hypothetical protein